MTLRDPLSTKIKILDAAEIVYAMDGIEGLTLRVITERAGVNLASINYHFGHKDALAHAMLVRILTPLYEERLSLLRTLETVMGPHLRPTHVATAVLLPLARELTRADIPPHRFAFYRRTSTDPSPLARDFITATFANICEQFDRAFTRSASDLDNDEALWRARLFFNALPGALCNQNTCVMLSHLLAQKSISVQDILVRFGVVMECATHGDAQPARVMSLVCSALDALSDSRTLRELALALPITPEQIDKVTVPEVNQALASVFESPFIVHSG